MASKTANRKARLIVMGAIEVAAIALVGVGIGIHNVGSGLAAAGLMIWINMTIGGMRKR